MALMSEDVGEKLDKLLRKGNSENEKAEKFEKHGQKQRCILVFGSADVMGNYRGEGAGGGKRCLRRGENLLKQGPNIAFWCYLSKLQSVEVDTGYALTFG